MHIKPDTDELTAWLRLSLEPNIGSAAIRTLLSVFGLPHNIYQASTGSLAAYIDPVLAANMRQPPAAELQATIDQTMAWLEQKDNHILCLADDNYPKALLNLKDPPIIIYAQGKLNILKQQMLAIVGSRSSTPQGNENAQAFALHLAQKNWCIVSGMASGIDTHAHLGALQAGANGAGTLAVLGTGIDIIYPNSNRKLAQNIRNQGLLISEFPLGTPALPANFPRRNRLVAALTQGVLVVEAARRSGSLITARLAADYGKEVYAIPGSIHSPLSRGCHYLIRQGAKLVESAQDIIEELNQAQLPLPTNTRPKSSASQKNTPIATADNRNHNQQTAVNTTPKTNHNLEQQTLLNALGYDYSDLESLQKRTGWPVSQLMEQLTLLELDGLISRSIDGQYIKNN